MQFFFSKKINMSILEKFYIDKSVKTNEVLNGFYMDCMKDAKGIVKFTGPINFENNFITLDKLKEKIRDKFDKTNFIYIDKQIKYNEDYYGCYFFHVNIDNKKIQTISFIDKPLSSIVEKKVEKKKVIEYTFQEKVISVKDNNDILYAIVNKNIELKRRYLVISNFYADKEKKLNGDYFTFFLESDEDLKKYMNGKKSIIGNIISFNNQTANDYLESIKESYKAKTIEYQRDFRMCEGMFNIGMFSNSGWENKLKNEPKKKATVICSFQSRNGRKKIRDLNIKTMEEELKEIKEMLTLMEKSIENFSKVKFIKIKKINNTIIANKYKYSNYTKGILKIGIYDKNNIISFYEYYKDLDAADALSSIEICYFYEILDPNNNSENKVNNTKKNGIVPVNIRKNGNVPVNIGKNGNVPVNIGKNVITNTGTKVIANGTTNLNSNQKQIVQNNKKSVYTGRVYLV